MISTLRFSAPLIFSAACVRGVALLLKVVLVGTMAITEYAGYSILLALFITMLPFSTFNMAASLSKVNIKEISYKNCYSSAVYLVLFLSVCCTGVFYYKANVLGFEVQGYHFFILLFGFVLQGVLSIHIGFELARLNSKRSAKIEFIDAINKLIIVTGAVLFFSVTAFDVILIQLSSSIITILYLGLGKIIKQIGAPSLAYITMLLKDGIRLVACSMIFLVYFFYIRELLYTEEKSLAAILDVAITLYSLPKMVFAAISRCVIPLAKNGSFQLPVNQKNTLVIFTGAAVTSSLLYFMHSSGYGPELFSYVGLVEYNSVFICLSILMLGAGFDFIYGLVSSFLFGRGSYAVVICSSLLSVALLLLISKDVVLLYGVYGSCLLYVFYYVLSLTLIFTSKRALIYAHKDI